VSMVSFYKNISTLQLSGFRYIVKELLQIIIGALLLFGAAGTMQWTRGWIYVGLIFVSKCITIFFLILKSPSLLNERGQAFKKGTKNFDKVFFVAYIILSLLLFIITGLDVVRYQWSRLPFIVIYPAIVLFFFSTFLGTWAMVRNPFFTVLIRVQGKSHRVCASGPYQYIRHPGYTSWIGSAISYPFLLGSLVSCIPVSIMILMFIIRTYLEDTSLQKELSGYSEYAATTKYRLLPYIW
jgi:protein-S-isoprenylcysteine O-methyltransferase Ste14